MASSTKMIQVAAPNVFNELLAEDTDAIAEIAFKG